MNNGAVISVLIGVIGALLGVFGLSSAARSSQAKKAAEKRADNAEKIAVDLIRKEERTVKEVSDAHKETEQIAEDRKSSESPAPTPAGSTADKLDRLRK